MSECTRLQDTRDVFLSVQKQAQVGVLIPLDDRPKEVVEVVEVLRVKVLRGASATSLLKGHGVDSHTEDDSDKELADVHDQVVSLVPIDLAALVLVIIRLPKEEIPKPQLLLGFLLLFAGTHKHARHASIEM